MQKHTRWLLAEIERWVAEGLVTPEQAGRLRTRYTAPETGTPWGLIVFATAGATVIGLGVILLFAYNWDAIPRFGKLALIFGALIAAHTGAVRLLAGEGWKPRLGEALAALATMFFGAGIWLVAQIYNIDEHYPNGFLIWALGAVAMAWSIRSTANALMAVVLLVIWGCSETFDFRSPEYVSVLLISVTLLPLAWKQRSAVLLAATVVAIQFMIAANLGSWGGSAHAFLASIALGVLLVAAARLLSATRVDFPGGAGVLAFLGFSGFLVCAYILTFLSNVDDLLDVTRATGSGTLMAAVLMWTLIAAAVAAWGWLARQALLRREFSVNREEWLLPAILLQCALLAAIGARQWEALSWLSFNLVLVCIAAMWMWRGCQESRLKPTVLGSLLLAAVVLARYYDLFESYASRGTAFIVLGGILVAEAFYYRRMKSGSEESQ